MQTQGLGSAKTGALGVVGVKDLLWGFGIFRGLRDVCGFAFVDLMDVSGCAWSLGVF